MTEHDLWLAIMLFPEKDDKNILIKVTYEYVSGFLKHK